MTPTALAGLLADWAARATLREKLSKDLPSLRDDDPVEIPDGWIDYRGKARRGLNKRGRSHGMRPWEQITGIGLHQTANAHLHANHPRILSIPAHALIDPDGKVVLLQPLQAYMWHGHHINRFTVGLEIVCRAAGIEGDMRTVWMSKAEKRAGKDPEDVVCEATDAQISAALDWCLWVIEHSEAHDCDIDGVYAHRQGHRSRVSDPGSRIWQHVAQELSAGMRLRDTTTDAFGSGKPIPDAWSGMDLGHRYSWRVR